jgi:hypothetical protein
MMPEIASRNTVYKTVFDINVRSVTGCPLAKRFDGEAYHHCNHPAAGPLYQKKGNAKCALDCTDDLPACPLEKHPIMLRRVPDWLDKAIDDATWKHSTGG